MIGPEDEHVRERGGKLTHGSGDLNGESLGTDIYDPLGVSNMMTYYPPPE